MAKAASKLHGSRSRYREGCRCVACSRSGNKKLEKPTDLRWPLRPLLKRHDSTLVQEHIDQVLDDPHPIDEYNMGIGDFDADRLAISLGDHPHQVWQGWLEAGLDYE